MWCRAIQTNNVVAVVVFVVCRLHIERPFDLDGDLSVAQAAVVRLASETILKGKSAAELRGYNSSK
jgi:hypothetical protein